MMSPDFLYRHTAQVCKWLRRGVSQDEYGEPVEIRCRIVLGRRVSQANSTPQTTVYAQAKGYFPANADIDEKDRVAFNGKTYRVILCTKRINPDGTVNHIEVELQ